MASRTRKLRLVALALAAALGGYLALWPVPIDPVAWHAPGPPPPEGRSAPNDRLRGVEELGRGVALGPEAIAIDARGRVHAGTRDGRVLRLDPATGALETVATTGGRPLGLGILRLGSLERDAIGRVPAPSPMRARTP